MCFPQKVKQEALTRSRRCCCVCHEFAGRSAEVHHIVQTANGGSDDLENAIVLCPRCHAEAGHYNSNHPKGNKYSPEELKKHRENWWRFCKNNQITAAIKTERKTAMKKVGPGKMTIVGNGNVQVGGNLIVKTGKAPDIKTPPPPGSIGSNPLLRQTIETKFNRLGEEREKRFGKSAYPAMYKTFKRDFKIKNAKWTIIWEWPENCAPDIISYLDDKYDNTIKGRIEKASKRSDHIAPRPQLYQMEKGLFEYLGWDFKGPEIREFLLVHFGVSSHKQLNHLQHWQLVRYLEGIIEKLVDEN